MMRLMRQIVLSLLMLTLLVGLNGCGYTHQITESLNPDSWFEAERVEAERQINTNTIPGEDSPYPQLSAMDIENPQDNDVRLYYDTLQKGLEADYKNANYTDQELRKMVSPSIVGVEEMNPEEALLETTEPEKKKEEPVSNILEAAKAVATPILEPPPIADMVEEKVPQAITSLDRGVLTNHPLNQAKMLTDLQRRSTQGGRLLANLIYKTNTPNLDAEGKQILQQVSRFFLDYEVRRLYIVGHASASDGEGFTSGLLSSYKQALDRAGGVGETLVTLGIPRELIQLDSRGEKQPIYSEGTPNGIIGNRRVEVYAEF